ncbi:MAG TPA: hypothetical protein VJ653_06830 [Acidimicrobiales bacterium]|nr:hypothetical protein [Acidimicrobiales bacterium]
MTTTDTSPAPNGQTAPAPPADTFAAGSSPPAGRSPLLQEYETALKKGAVSFEQVVQAAFGRRPTAPDIAIRTIHARYYPKLLQSFADAHVCPSRPGRSGIMHHYFADHIDAAAIMTADDELYVQFKPTGSHEVAFIDLLIRMTGVHIKARHVLQKEDYRTIMETVFVVISYCMSSLDQAGSDDPRPEGRGQTEPERTQVLRFLQSECARVEQDLDNIIHRRAERTYFNGMLAAVLGLGLAGVVLANLLDRSGNFDNYQYLLVAGLAGSIGATISVMWRITFGRFSPSNAIIAFQQGKKASVTLAVLGAVRPFIGAVFGIIVYALDRAGLLPLKPPDPGADILYFYAAIAFFAGFSERWAQSTLKNAIPLSGRTTPQPERPSPTPQAKAKPSG